MGAWQGAGRGVGLRDAGVDVCVEEEGRAAKVGGEIGEGCTVGGGPDSEEAEGCE